MVTKLVIIGTGGNSVDITEMIEEISESGSEQFEILGYLDDNEQLHHTFINNYEVLGNISKAKLFSKDIKFVFTIGSEKSFKKREKIFASLEIDENRVVSIIHPTARISKSAKIGVGSIIFPNVVVCSNVIMEDFCIILSNSVINHDCYLGKYSILASSVNLAGGVHIESVCYIGASASIKNQITVKTGTLIGMGSVILRNTNSHSVIVGNPGKSIIMNY